MICHKSYKIITLNENSKNMLLLRSSPTSAVLYIMMDNRKYKHKYCHSSNTFHADNSFLLQ
jgi:hypothetical protein